jgi:rRNA maturation endonuclease Nob1
MKMRGLYSNGYVVSVIVNGDMQHISKDGTIKVPFETEYKIRIQNKNNHRCLAKVFVDEVNVSEGGLIIDSFATVDLEGPVKSNRNFKFVSIESGQAHDAGKSKDVDGEKGVIRIEFQKEYIQSSYGYYSDDTWTTRYPSVSFCSNKSVSSYEEKTSSVIKPLEPTGCTVSGATNNQSFSYAQFTPDGKVTNVSLKLVGANYEVAGSPNVIYCGRCGLRSNVDHNFCTHCGNKLKQ